MSPPDPDPPPAPARTPLVLRVSLLAGGSVALILGALGTFLPLLPTTPFVLLAAGCYARAWPAAHRWLRANRFFGPICRSGEEGRYLPPRAKAFAVGITLASFGSTIVFATDTWLLRSVLATLALVVVTWLLRLPTRPQSRRAVPQRVRARTRTAPADEASRPRR